MLLILGCLSYFSLQKNQRQKIFEAQQRVTESLHHKQKQEEQDRLLAERLVLEELCANRTDPTIIN